MDKWQDGVLDSIKIIEDRIKFISIHSNNTKPNPIALAALEEILIELKAMLSRQNYSSKSVLAATFNPYDLGSVARYKKINSKKYINRTPNKEPYNIGLNLNDKNK